MQYINSSNKRIMKTTKLFIDISDARQAMFFYCIFNYHIFKCALFSQGKIRIVLFLVSFYILWFFLSLGISVTYLPLADMLKYYLKIKSLQNAREIHPKLIQKLMSMMTTRILDYYIMWFFHWKSTFKKCFFFS